MYKLDNGNLIKAPKFVHHEIDGVEVVTSNPPADVLARFGYKPLQEEQKPEISGNQALKEVLEDKGDVIVRRWEIIDLPDLEDFAE